MHSLEFVINIKKRCTENNTFKIIKSTAVTLPVILYRCEALREEDKLSAFQNNTLKKAERRVKRKLHGKKLYKLHWSLNINRGLW